MKFVTIKTQLRSKVSNPIRPHRYWIVKDQEGKTLCVQESMTEAIKFVEDEGLILSPNI